METELNEETTLEETSTDEAEEVVEEVDVESDSEEEQEENSNDDKQVETQPKKQKQSSEERKRFAEMRRARESKEKEDAISKAKQEGIIEGLGGINPYTEEKIVDDIDFKLYKEMKDAESKGYDPKSLTDMLKYRKSVELENQKKNEEEVKQKDNAKNDLDDFVKKNSDVDVKALLENEDFMDFAKDLIGKVPLDSIYKKYTKFQTTASKKAEDIAISEKARRDSSVGSLKTGDNANSGTYTMEEISKMSREDINKNYDKVMESYFKK